MAAIFDMDGLLLDTEPLWGESMLEVAEKHGVNIRSDFFKYTTGLRINEVTAFWKERFGWTSKISSDDMAEEIVDDIIARSIRSGRVMPGILQILEQLKHHNIKIGVATSSPARMMNTLIEHFGLMSYFQACVSADETNIGKPHPAVFIKCAEALNEKPWHCIAFEDSINGMVAAKAARMKVVVVPELGKLHKPEFGLADLVLSSMEEMNYDLFKSLID